MAVIVPKTVVTLAGRNYFANYLSNKVTSNGLAYFQIGVDGYTVVGTDKIPKEPDETRVTLEATDLGHFVFQKSFIPADLVVTGRELSINAVVLESEANDDGTGASPTFFEGGLFSDTNILLVYGTYPGIIKTSAFRITFKWKIIF